MIDEYKAKRYCKEDISKIENYDKAIADTTQVWDCHHRTEIWWKCTAQDLIDNECYYNRKACELIFLTHAEHTQLHMKGHIVTEETRRKISEAKKGRTVAEEHRKKISEALKGRTGTDETRRKMSEAHQNISDETRRKISEAKKGHIVTDETRRKISEAKKGRTVSDETRRKISEAKKERTVSDETRRKMSESHKCKISPNKGRTFSDEHRRKMSEAQKGKRKGMTWKVINGKRVWLSKEV